MERVGMAKLLATAAKKGWGDRLELRAEGSFTLVADLADVQTLLAKAIKPERALVDFVLFEDGKIEERRAADATPFRSPEANTAVPEKGVTVAKPTQGCPEPDFERADIRAREVLFAFLSPDQQEDFEKRNAFISTGAGTGHHYVVTSRHARDTLSTTRRQLYDLNEKRPFCVHDYAVPAAEEMLAIHLMLQDVHHERYLRHLE